MSAITSHPGQIQINTGTFTQECTTEYDLVLNQVKRPYIRDFMEYANRRALTTLISNGSVTPYGINNTEKTKFNEVSSKGSPIGNNAYNFPVMGRLDKAATILGQVGTTSSDGRFQLKMKDRYLYDGQNVSFYGNRFQARVEGNPTGSPASGYIYNFWAPSGDIFSWTSHVAPQIGTKTCFPLYTSYGERSEKSESRSKFADMFTLHTTIQRKSVAITGTAASQVLWYTFTAADGSGSSKGWMYEALRQAQALFIKENEMQKWFGVSSMKNSDGSLKNMPPLDNRGEPIIQGDGLEEQLAGGNVMEGTDVDGSCTLADITNMMQQLELKSDKINGCQWLIVTGTIGYAKLQTLAFQLGQFQNIQLFQNVTQDGKPGGAVVDMGYTFATMNINGNQVMFCKHPLFDDALAFPETGDNGDVLMSSTMFFLDIGTSLNKNVEILYKSANGVNRSDVVGKLNGMTGASEMVVSQEDAMTYAMLKEDLIACYNTNKCGIIYKRR
jgi:hypothetical protein